MVWSRKIGKKTIYYACFRWQGKPIREPTDLDRRGAAALERQRKIEIANGTYLGPEIKAGDSTTLDAYAQGWLARRKNRTASDDRQRYRDHISPKLAGPNRLPLGKRKLRDLRPRDVAELVDTLKAEGHAARTIRNVHSVLVGILKSAVFDEILTRNVARELLPGTLPKAGVRKVPPGSREDAERLIGAPEIDDDRRVLYGLLFLGGMRLGEGCGRRWRDLDANARPLWMLHVHDQYGGKPLKTARDEDTCERFVPVHPELQRLLEWWATTGFARVFGRAPRPEDHIVPDRRDMGSRTKNQALKALYRDCVRIGIPRRGTHSGRRWLMTYARTDGARGEIIERVTHNAAGVMIDRYTYFGWAPLCEELSKLRIALRLPSDTPSGVHSGDGSKGPHDDHVNNHQAPEGPAKASDFGGLPVEAPGVEPGSENGPEALLRA